MSLVTYLRCMKQKHLFYFWKLRCIILSIVGLRKEQEELRVQAPAKAQYPLFEFPSFLVPTNLGQPMQS